MSAITATVVSIAATAGGSYMSFRQAGQQGKAIARAKKEADKAIAEAKKRAEQNVYKQLSLTKDPYQRAREAALVTGAQAIEAGRESERGAAATAGRVQMEQNQLQGQIADVQSQQIQALNEAVATEDARLKDYAANINLYEAAGAQQAERDAQLLKTQATTQGLQQAASAVEQTAKALPLFYKSKGAKAYGKLADQAKAAGLNQEQLQNKVAELSKTPGFEGLAGVGYAPKSVDAQGNPIVGAMTSEQFQDYMIQNPSLVNSLIKRNIFAPQPTIGGVPYMPSGAAGTSYKDVSPDMIDPFSIYNR